MSGTTFAIGDYVVANNTNRPARLATEGPTGVFRLEYTDGKKPDHSYGTSETMKHALNVARDLNQKLAAISTVPDIASATSAFVTSAPAAALSKPAETDPILQRVAQDRIAREKAKVENAIAVTSDVSKYFYAKGEKITPRIWTHEGVDALSNKIVWIGPEKAEKSLFAVRKAMHESCGKDWFGYRSTGPIKVSYFDAENSTEDIDDRYKELLEEFTPEEQILIGQNLSIFKGHEYREKTKGANFEYDNATFWLEYAKQENQRGAVKFYFDCLYQFHSKQAKDNEGLKDVIDILHNYMGMNKGFTMLHHTHKESEESLGKQNKTALRLIGARKWSNKIYGGGHVKKVADVVICQERYEQRDGSTVTETFLDFAFFGRSIADSVLLSFQDDVENKFKRHLVISLSSHANQVRYALEDKHGPWKSKYAAAEAVSSVCSKRTAYERFKELLSKGYLIEGKDGSLRLRSGPGDLILHAEETEMTEEQSRSAKRWLLEFLKSGPSPVSVLREVAKKEGYNWESLRTNRGRWGVKSFNKSGETWWNIDSDENQSENSLFHEEEDQ